MKLYTEELNRKLVEAACESGYVMYVLLRTYWAKKPNGKRSKERVFWHNVGAVSLGSLAAMGVSPRER